MDRRRVRLETSEYEAAHGRKPRGYGHWVFDAMAGNTFLASYHCEGNYGDCRRVAENRAAIEVVPDGYSTAATVSLHLGA